MGSQRPRWRRQSFLVLAVATLASTGCAGLFASYDIAPNGQPRRDYALRQLLVAGQVDSALARVDAGAKPAPDDELLRALYEGVLAHYAGQYEVSGAALQRAADLADDRYTKRISRAALSLVSSDKVLPFEPGQTERLLIHYYGALNFLRQGELTGAAVEARRLGSLLERGRDHARDRRTRQAHAFLRYFSGLIFDAAGERNDADVAFRNAQALLGVDSLATDLELPDSVGEVVVVVEQGFVAHRVEQALVVPLHPFEVRKLTGGEAEDRLAIATGIAARIIVEAVGANSPRGVWVDARPRTLYVDPLPYSFYEDDCVVREKASRETWNGEDCGDRDDVPYILKIAWPTYRLDRPPFSGLGLVGPEGAVEPLLLHVDLSDAVVADFEEDRTGILARTVARATTKLAVTKGVEKKLGEKDEGAGQLVGFLANLGTALLEQADTRSWQLLPGQLGLARLRLPPGAHTITLEIPGAAGGPSRRIELGSAVVAPGRRTFFSARVWP